MSKRKITSRGYCVYDSSRVQLKWYRKICASEVFWVEYSKKKENWNLLRNFFFFFFFNAIYISNYIHSNCPLLVLHKLMNCSIHVVFRYPSFWRYCCSCLLMESFHNSCMCRFVHIPSWEPGHRFVPLWSMQT